MPQHPFTIDNLPAPQVRAQINLALQALASVSSGSTQPPVTFAGMFWLDTGQSPPVLRVRNAANNGWIEVGQLSADGMNIGGRVPQVVSTTAPASPSPGMQWVDTSQNPPIVRIRNGGNTDWITIAPLPDVLLRDGSQAMTGRLDLAAGASGGLGFAGDTGTGLVRDAANTLRLRTNGSNRMTLTNTGIEAHVPLTVPAATAAGHAVRLDQLPSLAPSIVRQVVTATHSTNASTTSSNFVTTGASIAITPTQVPCRLLVFALIPQLQCSYYDVGYSVYVHGEVRFSSSLGNSSAHFVYFSLGPIGSEDTSKSCTIRQAVVVRDERVVSSPGTYTFTLQMRNASYSMYGSSGSVSTNANVSPIQLEAREIVS